MAEQHVKLFVGTIPHTVDENMLREMFAPYGNIESTVIIRDRTTGQHKGSGFVVMQNKQQADSAIAGLNEKRAIPPLQKPMMVKYATGEAEKLEFKLFIGNVPKTASDDALRQVFQQYGEIVTLTVLKTPSGESKGAAFLEYASKDQALRAIAALDSVHTMDGGRSPLAVRFAESEREKQAKKQQRTRDFPPQGHHPNGGGPGYFVPQPVHFQPPGYNPPQGMMPQAMMPVHDQHMGFAQPPVQPPWGQPPPFGAPVQQPGYFDPNGVPMQPMQPAYGVPQQMAPIDPNKRHTDGPDGCNLMVSNLPMDWGDAQVMQMFSQYGNIPSVKVYVDRNTGQSRGFAFLSYDNPTAASNAIQGLNGMQVGQHRLKVNLKKPHISVNPMKPY